MPEKEEDKPEMILATNPLRLQFNLGEATGGGPADGMELCVMIIEGWENDNQKQAPKKIVFSRASSELIIKALVTYLARDDTDRAIDYELADPEIKEEEEEEDS